jgi:hypothetical protein
MSYTNYRMLPPVGGHTVFLPGNGRRYEAADGVPVDVPDFDTAVLGQQGPTRSNVWSISCNVPVGATAARPTNPIPGELFLDTTVGAIIAYNGVRGYWINPATGVQV